MWKDINNYIHMHYNTKVGFLFCPINVYKKSLNT